MFSHITSTSRCSHHFNITFFLTLLTQSRCHHVPCSHHVNIMFSHITSTSRCSHRFNITFFLVPSTQSHCSHLLIGRVGQNHIYTVYIRYFWLGNHQIYCVYIRIYTANPTYRCYDNITFAHITLASRFSLLFRHSYEV
jgi:hypothetical protein